MAELTFQRVISARPKDPDGYEGLAMVYKAIGHKHEAVILIDEALKFAKKRFAEEYIDEEILREIAMNQGYIHEMEDEEE
jgi:Flp pilus assembly protein TadD